MCVMEYPEMSNSKRWLEFRVWVWNTAGKGMGRKGIYEKASDFLES